VHINSLNSNHDSSEKPAKNAGMTERAIPAPNDQPPNCRQSQFIGAWELALAKQAAKSPALR